MKRQNHSNHAQKSSPKDIAVIASGIGGLFALARMKKVCAANLYYSGDLFSPESHTEKECFERAKSVVSRLAATHFFACFAIADVYHGFFLPELRRQFPDFVFFGCEVPFRSALEYSAEGALLLGRKDTICRLPKIVGVTPLSFDECCRAAERGAYAKEFLQLAENLFSQANCRFDAVILASAHLSVYKALFYRLYPAAATFDCTDGLVSALKRHFGGRGGQVFYDFSAAETGEAEKFAKFMQEIYKYY